MKHISYDIFETFANLLIFTYLKLIIVFSQSKGNALFYSIASNGVGNALLQENYVKVIVIYCLNP